MDDQTTDISERRLISRMQDGDLSALEDLYVLWSPSVYSLARGLLKDHHDAEDITQQVFVSAWRSRETLRPGEGSLAGWLITITRRRCADLHTVRAREMRRVAAVAVQEQTPLNSEAVDDLAASVVLAQEIDLLGDPRSTIVRLALIEDRPHDEISERLRIPLGTVKSHLRRGLIVLRRRMEESP